MAFPEQNGQSLATLLPVWGNIMVVSCIPGGIR